MKKALYILLGAVGGLCFCIGIIKSIEIVGPYIYYPVFAGEEDFNQRFLFFIFGLLPGFLFVGSWIGYSFFCSIREGSAKFIGVLIGTSVYYLLLWLLRHVIAKLPNSYLANAAVFISFMMWIIFAVIMAMIFSKYILSGRKTR